MLEKNLQAFQEEQDAAKFEVAKLERELDMVQKQQPDAKSFAMYVSLALDV